MSGVKEGEVDPRKDEGFDDFVAAPPQKDNARQQLRIIGYQLSPRPPALMVVDAAPEHWSIQRELVDRPDIYHSTPVGRASCRERGVPSVSVTAVAGSIN